jgi:iron complex outermembrane receptor protein
MRKLVFATGLIASTLISASAFAQVAIDPMRDTRPAAPADQAQQAPPPNSAPAASDGFGDIVVTAQRRSNSLQRVPMAISALDSQDLSRAPVSNLADIQNLVPSVNISPRNSSGVVTIRGIGFDIVTAGAESSVAIHSDGVYQSRPTAALAGLYDDERIEVARGPQGTLYGRNATGGAINIISRHPTDELSGYFNLTYGNYNALSLEGAVSGGIVPGKLDVRVAAKIEHRDGFGTNFYNNRDVDDLKTRAIRGMMSFTPSDNINFLLITDYFKRDDSSFPTHFLRCVTLVCNANSATNRGYQLTRSLRDVNEDVQAVNRQDLYGVALTSTINLSFADLVSITAYRAGKSYFIFDFDGTAQPGAFITREENHHEFSQEVQLGQKGSRFDWLVGAYYFHERNFARANGHFPLFLAPNLTTYFQGGTLFTDAFAGFGEVTWHAFDRLSFTVGARYSNETKRIADEYTFSRGPANLTSRAAAPTAAIPCVTCRGLPDKATFSSFTPKFGAQFEIDANRLIYVTAQKGFKSGSFAVGAVSPAFAPESIWSYETGLKASWFDRHLITNISAYHYDYSNLQVGQTIGVATFVSNAGSAKVDGVELEVRAKLGDHFQIDGQGAYNHARFASYMSANAAISTAVQLDLAGNSLSNAPKWTGDLGAEVHGKAFDGRVALRGDVFASSHVYFSPFNNLTNSQDAYTLTNVILRYDSAGNRWFASAFVNNLTNNLVVAGTNVVSGTVGAFANATLLPPRTYGIKIGYSS